MDYYSNFLEVDELSTTTAPAVITDLKNLFARYSCPKTVISDNGPQFVCETFANFAKDWEFEHRTISPWNSKTNGKAEAAVKMAKKLLRKAQESKTDIWRVLLDQTNTPTHKMNTSPVQRFFNRRTRTFLSTKETLLHPRVPPHAVQRQSVPVNPALTRPQRERRRSAYFADYEGENRSFGYKVIFYRKYSDG